MSKNDNELVKTYDMTIGKHTFNIARMPAIVAVNVVKRYSLLTGMLQKGNVDERKYMRNMAGIVQYVLRNLICDHISWFDRFKQSIVALLVSKRRIMRLAKEEFNALIDAITTIALGDKKKEIEVQEKAYKAMVDQLGHLTEQEFASLFASLRPSLEKIRRDFGERSPSKNSSTTGVKAGATT